MTLTFEFLHDLVGLFRHLLVYILTLLIVFINMISLCECFLEIALYQQVNSLSTILHTARGIDTRTYLEDNIAHCNLAFSKTAYLNNRLQTYRW